jgi:hypothetical protein
MKKFLLGLTLCITLSLTPYAVYAEDFETQENTQSPVVNIDNLSDYNLVALNDADVNCHIRGSIYVGGVLTGNQYIDDGSMYGEPGSESYVYDNQSNLYFQSRTVNQSLEAYQKIDEGAASATASYWENLLASCPNDGDKYVYLKPKEDGSLDVKKWDYYGAGSDEAYQKIPILYWTDAKKVEMGGLAGHLIAPLASVFIVSCNHCGSIVGKNIYTDGEAHINYWKPEFNVTPTPIVSPTTTPVPTPVPTTTPDPTPTVTPDPTPTVSPKPTPTVTPDPTSTPMPTQDPTTTPDPTTAPTRAIIKSTLTPIPQPSQEQSISNASIHYEKASAVDTSDPHKNPCYYKLLMITALILTIFLVIERKGR